MTRRVDESARSDLVDRIVAYTLTNGIASLSLRALAKELNVSAGSLLYHFRSKEELIVEILTYAGDRQRAIFGSMQLREDPSPGEVCRAVWAIVGAPESRALFKLFFEVYGLALIDPDRFPNFFPGAIENWLAFLAPPFRNDGMTQAEARVHATIVLAGFRGFLLDLCATSDSERIDRAVALWIASLA